MKKKLCIIIPMYNAEKYIEETIDSILSSNLPHDMYSILVINDGSTDKSPATIENIARTNSCVKMFTQENGGLSMARNSGISECDADYIWFFDADDLSEKNLNCIADILNSEIQADVYAFEYNWLNENKEFIGIGCRHPSVEHNKIIKGRDAIIQGYKPGSVCGMLIKRDFIKKFNLLFQKGITHEDVVFTYQMMAVVPKIYFSNEKIYNYILRQNTMSRAHDLTRKKKYLLDNVEVINSFYSLASLYQNTDVDLYNAIKEYADRTLFGCVYELYKHRKEWKQSGISKVVLDKLKKDKLYPIKISTNSWKKRIAIRTLNIEWVIY